MYHIIIVQGIYILYLDMKPDSLQHIYNLGIIAKCLYISNSPQGDIIALVPQFLIPYTEPNKIKFKKEFYLLILTEPVIVLPGIIILNDGLYQLTHNKTCYKV